MLIWVLVSLLCLQLLAWPILAWVSSKSTIVKDGLWAFGRLLGLLLVALVVFFLAWLKLPINTTWGIRLVLFVFLLIDLWLLFFSHKQEIYWERLTDYWQRYHHQILSQEVIFALFFAFELIMRNFQPEILGLEKFMDAGFIQAYLKSPTLPAQDMWLANSPINYYSFGHFLMAILTQIWTLDLAWSYNFLLATWAGLMASQVFSLVFNWRANSYFGEKLGKDFSGRQSYNFKASWWTAFLACFLVVLFGNGHALWYFFSQGNFQAYWYPDATRFIERTIHEFPAYSFVVADLHAHVLSMPLVIAGLMTIFLWLSELIEEVSRQKVVKLFGERFFYLSLLVGSLFGILVMTNTWDVLVYGGLLIFLGLLLLSWRRYFFWPLVSSALGVALSTLLISSPWLLTFQSIAEGVKVASEHTPFWQLLVLWGPQLLLVLPVTISFLWQAKKWPKKERLAWFFFMGAVMLFMALLLFTELFYFKDIYLAHQRANTMFKLMFQGFIILSLLLAMTISYLWTRVRRSHFFSWRLFDLRSVLPSNSAFLFKIKSLLRVLILFYLPILTLIFFLGVYPYLAFKSYYGAWKNWQGLNGLTWMVKKHPSSYAIVNYLKQTESKQVNIVEASGESYSEFSLVSAFSGMPTILGWQVHEWLWRGSWDVPSARLGELRELYLRPRSPRSRAILDQYQIKYLVLTERERSQYPELDEIGLLSLGKVVWQNANDYLILIQKSQ